LQVVLLDDRLVLEGVIQVAGLDQGDELDAGAADDHAGTGFGLQDLRNGDVGHVVVLEEGHRVTELALEHLTEQARLTVLGLGQKKDHHGAVARGVEAWVGNAHAHTRAGEHLIPVLRVDLISVLTERRVGQRQVVAGKLDVPGCIRQAAVGILGGVHQHGDQGVIGGGHHVNGFVQLGDVADHLDGAVALVQYVNMGVAAFEGFFQVIEGENQAARAKDAQRHAFGSGGCAGGDRRGGGLRLGWRGRLAARLDEQ